jgi:hypothetical protein
VGAVGTAMGEEIVAALEEVKGFLELDLLAAERELDLEEGC